METPQGEPTRDEIIDQYIKTLAKVIGSEEEARMKIYSVSTRCYYAFGALVSKELSCKLRELPGVTHVLPDSYLDIENKNYGGNYLPGIPMDEIPDLRSCLLYQQLQVINCCVSRKMRLADATESVNSVMRDGNLNAEELAVSEGGIPAGPLLYAKLSTGELVLRLGADRPTCNLRMLETGEPIYSPITQEGPLLTEDLIKETEELVLRTGSMGAGCSQLLSDMQAFKAANPGCTLNAYSKA